MKNFIIILCEIMVIALLIGCNPTNQMLPTEGVQEATIASVSDTTLEEVLPTEEATPTEETIPEEEVLIEDETDPIEEVQEDITFTVELFNDNKDIMPYFLYTPSTRENSSEPIPMIIWLHGGDDYNCKFESMSKRGLPGALSKWGDLEGFDAYVLCPQWTGNWKIAGWHNPKLRAALDNVIADVLAKNPIDTEKIIISGHSMGGRGAICNALHNANEFDYYKVATVSGFLYDEDLPYVKDLNIRFYTGKTETGEYKNIYNFNTKKMVELYGEENLFIVDGSHGTSPINAFLLDEDGNNKSDLIEWMLADEIPEIDDPIEQISDNKE